VSRVGAQSRESRPFGKPGVFQNPASASATSILLRVSARNRRLLWGPAAARLRRADLARDPFSRARKRWLMMGPANGGMLQVFVHPVVLPKFARDCWSPGVLTALLLHVPIGVAWYREQAASDAPLTRKDIAKGMAWTGVFIVFGLALPHKFMPRRDNPYPFSKRQLGRHAR
jgi:hypothetical protein